MTRTGIAIVVATLLVPLQSLAVDGVREINQACAVHTGCFPGDTPGFPVTITDPGSYRLTGNLDVPLGEAETDAIEIPTSINAVELDLNGFIITGPEGSGRGIASASTIRVRGGTISGFGFGVQGGALSSVERAEVSSLFTAIGLGPGSLVSNVRASGDEMTVLVGSRSRIINSVVVAGLTFDAVAAGSGSSIIGNAISSFDTGDAISGTDLFIRENNIHLLGGVVRCSGTCAISDNVVVSEAFSSPLFPGIVVQGPSGEPSQVERNVVRVTGSTEPALQLSATTTYRDNTVTSGAADPIDGGIDMGGNSCNGAATCP